ncbi:hypothetical protein KFU94_34625 [Chloroflexi bacterium TSY]|nr:hypothetical protein [Chloroflexi bacterium TSY]
MDLLRLESVARDQKAPHLCRFQRNIGKFRAESLQTDSENDPQRESYAGLRAWSEKNHKAPTSLMAPEQLMTTATKVVQTAQSLL